MFLGKRAGYAAIAANVFSFYGSMLAYSVLAGIFLNNLYPALSSFRFSILFFLITSFFLFLKLDKVAEINFFLSLPIFVFIIVLFFTALPDIKWGNFDFSKSGFSDASWFFPYGVWVFALSGLSAIPDVRDLSIKKGWSALKKIVVASLFFAAVLYWMFILVVYGLSGASTSEDGLSGLAGILGSRLISIGSVIGFLAVFTSYLAMGVDLRLHFSYDWGMPKFSAWLATFVPAIVLFLLGIDSFSKIIAAVGSVGTGIMGSFIILMAKKRGPVLFQKMKSLNFSALYLSWVALVSAVFYEIYTIITG
jgi:amino acid permease